MTIHQHLWKHVFDPDEISRIVSAYEDTLTALGLSNRADPMTEIVASKVIEVAKTGELDPARIKQLVLRDLGASS